MATLTIPNSFINGTTAVATEVNSNFTAVKTFAEGISSGVNIDSGAVAFSQIATAAVTSISASVLADAAVSDQVILGMQVFS